MARDQELCEEYGLDADDEESIRDARFLEEASTLAGYEFADDLLDFNGIRERIDQAYQRALSSDNSAMIALVQRAVNYHGRVVKMLRRHIEGEREMQADVSERQMASDFIDRIGRGAYAPEAVLEGLRRAIEVLMDGYRPPGFQYSEIDAVIRYMHDLKDWLRSVQHDVAERGYSEAVLRQLEPLIQDWGNSDEIRKELRHRGEMPLIDFLINRGNGPMSERRLATTEDSWFW